MNETPSQSGSPAEAPRERRPRVLAIVPARGGSKGVPRKNVRLLGGRPLLAYTALAATQSGVCDRIVLSTDDAEIAQVGADCGLEVPGLRPAELAQDDTPMLPVLQHVLETLAGERWQPDVVLVLQPTSPLRRPTHLREAVHQLVESGADSVVTVVELPRHQSPDYVMRIEGGRLLPFLPDGARVTRRQDARAAYVREGTVYACWRATIEHYGNIYGEHCRPMLIEPRDSLSIDSLDDWAEAERRLAAV
jgi:CMP-N,N'-diacetyllegionaminic acid synthase